MNYFDQADLLLLAEAEHCQSDELILEIVQANLGILSGVLWEIPADYQEDIDVFCRTRVITDSLRSFMKGAQEEGHDLHGMLDVIRLAYAGGVPTICIDSSKTCTDEYKTRSRDGRYFLRGESRDHDMAMNICKSYQSSPGKYVVIVGAGHAVSHDHHRTGRPAMGWFLDRFFRNNHLKLLLKKGKASEFQKESLSHLLAH
jgi:hypothetical protein